MLQERGEGLDHRGGWRPPHPVRRPERPLTAETFSSLSRQHRVFCFVVLLALFLQVHWACGRELSWVHLNEARSRPICSLSGSAGKVLLAVVVALP